MIAHKLQSIEIQPFYDAAVAVDYKQAPGKILNVNSCIVQSVITLQVVNLFDLHFPQKHLTESCLMLLPAVYLTDLTWMFL